MQITRQADYAIRAMHYLSTLKYGERAATSRIAETKRIPSSFLAKIISQLSIAGLINTSRGAHGGVSLARTASEISILDVVEAIDGPVTLNDCTLNIDACGFGPECPIRPIWCESQAELVNRLKSTSFALLV
jgi:Rrf2 family protein